jgi:hypothetical protein
MRDKTSSHPSMLSFISRTSHSEKKTDEEIPRKASQADLEWAEEEGEQEKHQKSTSSNGRKNGQVLLNTSDEKNHSPAVNHPYPHDFPPLPNLSLEVPNENNGLNDQSLQQLQSVQQYNWDLIEAMNRHIESPARISQLPLPERLSRGISGSSTISGQNSFDELLQHTFSFSSGTEFFHRFPHISATSSVYGDILELLHCHIVLAASRTIAAGDAFIILNDLYGGDGLLLCPNPAPRITVSSSMKSPSRQNGADLRHHHCDISIAITTTGIKVILKERYRLYASAELDHCTSKLSDVTPLMSFECITTTLLLLSSEVYLSLSPSRSPSKVPDALLSSYEKAVKLLNVLVTDPDRICHRAVTIEPYVS